MSGDEDDYFVPLIDQRVFGAGIKKKGIKFVPASRDESKTSPIADVSAGERYLAMVLSKTATTAPSTPEHGVKNQLSEEKILDRNDQICPVCQHPVVGDLDNNQSGNSHYSSIAHQVCMEHSHPPSHLDRERAGLKYLSGFGWDPDARKGLGTRQEGILHPIKAREKRDTTGLGVDAQGYSDAEDADHGRGLVKRTTVGKRESKIIKTNAKEVRKLEREKKQKAERLRQAFYGEDLSQYLGPGG